MNLTKRVQRMVVALVLFSAGGGCGGGAKLPDGQEGLDLKSAGLNVKMTAPPGGSVEKRTGIHGAEAEVTWGQRDKRAGGFTVSTPRSLLSKLACDAPDGPECKVVESDDTSVIKTLKTGGRESTWFRVHVKAAAGNIDCYGSASSLENARRLRDACKTAQATGPLGSASASASASAPAATSPVDTKPTAPALEEKKFTDKLIGKDQIEYSIKVPAGWSSEQSGMSRTFQDPAAKSKDPKAALSALTIMVGGFSAVKDLDAAEKLLKQEDVGGLDSFAKKEILPSKAMFFETAPRGALKLITITTIAKGKKQTGRARCSGPESARATLSEVCSSLRVE